MPSPRSVLTKGISFTALTVLRDDRAIEGSWSHPDVPLLIFDDNTLPGGAGVSFHGGSIGTGMPVQLIFWGAWWLSADGSNRRSIIEARTQALLASDYFSELKQYGVDRPHWRGAAIVTEPAPPTAFNSTDDEQAVPDLIDDLIDDDVFPDPDDERIAFVVFMPAGFTQTISANGAHTYDYDYEFPFDWDYYWVAWVRSFGDVPGEDPEDAIRTMSHELVELFTDPESDGWYAGGASTGEVGDAAVSPGVGKQTAWVNGAHVQGYWSNRHAATVIPIDRDYMARIRGAAVEESEQVVENGTFRPDPRDEAFCRIVPACCLPDRDFTYEILGHNEVIRLHVETQRYRQPTCAWNIEGVPVTANGNMTFNVLAQHFTGRNSSTRPTDVTISIVVNANTLELRLVGEKVNFDLRVGCSVTDASITGKVRVNVVATPSVTVGFAAAELVLDPEYVRDRKACNKAVADMFGNVGHGGISQRPKPGEPVIIDPGVLAQLPAYARARGYRAAREAVFMARMGAAVLPAEAARAYAISLASDVPALADVLEAHSSARRERHPQASAV